MTSLAELDEALAQSPDAVLLDNMPVPMLKAAVAKVAGRTVTEASGGVTLDTVRADRRDRRRPHFRRGAHPFGAQSRRRARLRSGRLTDAHDARLILPQLLRRSCGQPPPGHIKTPRSVAVALVEALPSWISQTASSSGACRARLGFPRRRARGRQEPRLFVLDRVVLRAAAHAAVHSAAAQATRACVRANPRSTSRSGAAGGERD